MTTQTETAIHPTAVVQSGAELDIGVTVGPFCLVGKNVKIGKGTQLLSHVVVEGFTSIGENNEIFPFASVGHAPQDLKYRGEKTFLEIGNNNKIRESTTLQPGTVGGGALTKIGNKNLFMAYCHVAHDCMIGDENVFANCVQLAGHVTVHNQAVIAALSAVHQFCRIGDLGMTGGGSMVAQDLPPFCTVQGDHAVLRSLNLVAMKRRGFSTEVITAVKAAFKILFWSGCPTVEAAVEKVKEQGFMQFPEVLKLVEFVQSSSRGVCRPQFDARNPE